MGTQGLGPIGSDASVVFDRSRNKYVLSHTTATAGGKSYLYLTVGCGPYVVGDPEFADNGPCDRNTAVGATDFAIRMFRQVD